MPTLRFSSGDGQFDIELTDVQWKTYQEARAQGRLHVLAQGGHYVLAEEIRLKTPEETKDPEWTVEEKGHVFAMGDLVPAHGSVNTYTGKRISEGGPLETIETRT